MTTTPLAASANNSRELNRALTMLLAVVALLTAIAGIPGERTMDDAELAEQLSAMRSAVSLYAADHEGTPPGTTSWDEFVRQLTTSTDATGAPGTAFGPYLVAELITGTGRCIDAMPAAPTDDATWLWSPSEQRLAVNRSGHSSDGTSYFSY